MSRTMRVLAVAVLGLPCAGGLRPGDGGALAADGPKAPAPRNRVVQEKDLWSLAFSPDGKVLASGGLDKTILLWDVRPQK